MSYITFDYKCPDCGAIDTRLVKREEMDEQACTCETEMRRLPAGTRTTFLFADTKLKG
ncbi:MAG: FmdB family zinc ribbon protein [Planctomycetota bacterium]|jgi:hypothetical protein